MRRQRRVIEVSGVIKWFDVAKGYGFIVPDNGMADVLLHVTCLRRDGYQTAYEGARVVCEVLARPKGLQAFRVISMDESTAIHPAQMPPPRTHVTVTPTSGLERAQVKWFNRLRGFGFLTRGEGTPDIFVHMETLRRFGMTELRPGQFVLVRYGPGPKGLMAAEVHPGERTARSRLALAAFAARFVAIADGRRRRAAPRHCWSPPAPRSLPPSRRRKRPDRRTLEIVSKTGVHAFAVELATNDAERSRGLMFRKELPEGHGMLFDFERDQPVAFWMHNTYISLDMIFIARRRTHPAHCRKHRAAVGPSHPLRRPGAGRARSDRRHRAQARHRAGRPCGGRDLRQWPLSGRPQAAAKRPPSLPARSAAEGGGCGPAGRPMSGFGVARLAMTPAHSPPCWEPAKHVSKAAPGGV